MWSNVLVTDLLGNPIGELPNSYDRRLSFALRRMATQTFGVRLGDPLADVLLDGHALVKTYEGSGDTWELRFVGDVVAAEEKGAEGQKRVEVTAADAFWRLGHTAIGRTVAGFKRAMQDRGLTALEALAEANSVGDTGVRPGIYQASANDVAGPWYFKPVSEVVAEGSAPLDGYAWRISPVEPFLDAAFPYPRPVIGLLDISALFGAQRGESIFEYGTGRHNVRDYSRAVTKEGLANLVYVPTPGFPQAEVGLHADAANAFDPVAASQWGLHVAVVQADFGDAGMRSQLAGAHLKVRATPRQVITFSPIREDTHQQVPRFKVDYDLGDVVPFRAIDPERYAALVANGTDPGEAMAASTRVDAELRVYGVDVAIDSEGQEQATLTLVEGGG